MDWMRTGEVSLENFADSAVPSGGRNMAGRQLSDDLCPTIFHEHWWLQIASKGDFEAVQVSDAQGPVAWMPYFPRRRLGAVISTMPPLTHFIGPVIRDDGVSPGITALRQIEIIRSLLRQLPRLSFHRCKCYRGVANVVAFQQEDFFTSVQFTVEIGASSADELWRGLSPKRRNEIRIAQRSCVVDSLDDVGEFWRFYESKLAQRGISNKLPADVVMRLLEACLSRGRGRIYVARDKLHRIQAAAFCAWDTTSSYYLMSSRRIEAQPGSSSLVAWSAIKEAVQARRIFDFDGTGTKNGFSFFAKFGGAVTPRYIVTRGNLVGRSVWALKEVLRPRRFFY